MATNMQQTLLDSSGNRASDTDDERRRHEEKGRPTDVDSGRQSSNATHAPTDPSINSAEPERVTLLEKRLEYTNAEVTKLRAERRKLMEVTNELRAQQHGVRRLKFCMFLL
jgi:hypothetical protein